MAKIHAYNVRKCILDVGVLRVRVPPGVPFLLRVRVRVPLFPHILNSRI